MSDPIFREEQLHLEETYDKLADIERDLSQLLEASLARAREDKKDLLDELATDFGNGVNLETYVEFEAMHQVIDAYNQANDIRALRLNKARILLRRPYFAKVTLQFSPSQPPRDIYIGATGMTDEMRRHFIIDWRSPVAEVYYNQSNGRTSYEANGRTIECDLQLRRQFDLEGRTLHSYFDTTVAIQDPLLLKSLARGRSGKLGDITATIQREQNEVIRHDDVPALLVSGIAGSGKTSVLLQRIAYLFYRLRDDLNPADVYLLSPNSVFANYIDNVLPDMGESNPVTFTWEDFMKEVGLADRALGGAAAAETLEAIDGLLPSLSFDANDFCDIRVGDERVISAGQVRGIVNRHAKRIPVGSRLAALVEEELEERLASRARRRAAEDEVQEAVLELPTDELCRIFGTPPHPDSEKEFRDMAQTYLEDRYRAALRDIRAGNWLRIDRIGMRVLGKQNLSAVEYLYLKMALTGVGNRHARFVCVDEVQDYTQAQLMVLARWFRNAHFLLLGDANQAIKPETATFGQIRRVFATLRERVDECRLLTSYRSSPEITALFQRLMDGDGQMNVQSVQREGVEPHIVECADEAGYAQALDGAIAHAGEEGLTAVIANNPRHARELAASLGGRATLIGRGDGLPASGTVVLDLELAKGLEFDQVVVADASAAAYDAGDLSRHRLYVAISRATQRVTLLSRGPLTPLLA